MRGAVLSRKRLVDVDPMLRFVLLEHDHPYLHWDFMLEAGAALRTWRLAALPQSGLVIAAWALGEHRRAYLDFEGPVSGNRGRVVRWDSGVCRVIADEDVRLVIELSGSKLIGTATLERQSGERWQWQFVTATP